MKIVLTALFSFGLAGCASSYWVRQDYKPKGGVIGYKTQGLINKNNDQDAEKKMKDYCYPQDYEILSTGFGSNIAGAMAMPQQNNMVMMAPITEEHIQVTFKCTN